MTSCAAPHSTYSTYTAVVILASEETLDLADCSEDICSTDGGFFVFEGRFIFYPSFGYVLLAIPSGDVTQEGKFSFLATTVSYPSGCNDAMQTNAKHMNFKWSHRCPYA